jgi:glycosyltransferase involved in cell wall biosynthesis
MFKIENIGLIHQSITGVKNPVLQLVGTKKNNAMEIEIYCDDKKVDYNCLNVEKEEDFNISAIIPRGTKYVTAYVINKGKKEMFFKQRMSIVKRILHKIKWTLKSFLSLLKAIFVTLGKGIRFFWKEYHFLVPPRMWGKYWKDFVSRVKVRGTKLYLEPNNINEYNQWLEKYEQPIEYKELKYKPLISIVIPVYNIGREYLAKCIDSILNQKYDNFEICLVDDASTNEETLETLREYEEKDKRVRVKYRQQNGHISNASNDGIKMAKGEFISLVDDDDELTEDALYSVVYELNKNKKLDFIYSDEDKLDTTGRRCYPNFKPDWSPDTLLSLNYICHLTTIRKALVDKVGGFRVGFEGAQDFDLFLRVTELTDKIYHIPRILYHWRMVEGSTSMVIDNKSYAVERGKKAIEDALKRRKINGHVEVDEKSTYYKVIYDIKKEPLVSIIIPTKDYADVTETCLKSLYEKTSYKNFEVILMNNNSEKEETFKLFDEYKKKYKNFRVIDANYEFNYSKINNQAVRESKGDYICLLNNDTEIVEPNWLTYMIGYAMQDHVGTVGAKLFYPDGTVQHAGTIMGLGGVASHAYIGRTKDKFNSVKGLEEDLKVAYNDVDFNMKLLEKGYKNVFVPMAQLTHFESKSRGYDTTSEKYKRFKEEENYMYEKWDKYISNDPYYNPNYALNMWFKIKK